MINSLIVNGRAVYYGLTEPIKLMLSRIRKRRHDEKPLISVYCPTYNRGDILIDRAVRTVLTQSYRNFEFIIVGDCCTDNTEELVKKIDDPRIKFFNLKKRKKRYPPTPENHWLAGPVVAANFALTKVKGDWIARIDDDDIWTPDHLEQLLHFALQTDAEFVSSRHMEERNGVSKCVMPYEYFYRGLVPKKCGGTQTWLYRSYLRFFRYNIDCWRKDINRVNDIDISYRMYQAGVRMFYLPYVTAYILPRPGEHTVGLEAYTCNSDMVTDFYNFE